MWGAANMSKIEMSVFQSKTYCFGGFRGVEQKDIDSFSDLLGAAHETAAKALSVVAEPVESRLSNEDMAYLRGRYSGELTAVEVVRAVRAVYSMGGMSRVEYCAVWGARIRADGTEDGVPAFPELLKDDELARYAHAPIGGFHSLDDLFQWLDELRGNDPEWNLLRMGLENA